jgi:hypothetical protein
MSRLPRPQSAPARTLQGWGSLSAYPFLSSTAVAFLRGVGRMSGYKHPSC